MNGHHLKLLKELSENNTQSQRELSKKLGLSHNNSKNKIAYMYILTPSGIKKKMQLSHAFLKRKLYEYEMLKVEIEELKREVGPDKSLSDLNNRKNTGQALLQEFRRRISSVNS